MSTTVAYLGPEGTFTEAALLAFAGAGAFGVDRAGLHPAPVASPAAALDAVRSAQADFAVVAIENSVDGAVTTTYDALVDGDRDVQIFYEHELEIAFSIMARPGTTPEQVRRFATHPVGHQQVRHWLAEHLPSAEFVPASSNAAAAKMVADGEADAAAAPARAAELFGLEQLATGVADSRGARTRFVVVGRRGRPTPRTGNDTTSVVFTLAHQPGTLVAALQDFAVRGVDLTRIASRPTRRSYGTYLFYVDVAGHIDDTPVAEALRALWMRAEDVFFLGSWPSATPKPSGGAADLELVDRAAAWVEAAQRGERG
ncbi:prephenate dehydratase [Corynebacterium uterequi]|uniref:Prephenate dehydratase n=1 Tax=Corynebacterium uterequi TaxID=1072256 RepID=A0A0G3HH13_9CORY|nr:prephenate dehydratase [Corynebacterium uterequi]AKK12075.1 prephenate dehydratase [Corynebacterium uterequi]